jgi:hypothetical protein
MQDIYDNEEQESSPDEMRGIAFTTISVVGVIVALLVAIILIVL